MPAAPRMSLGVPEDIANLVSFWASPDSAFITGQTWIVDGGTCFDWESDSESTKPR
jgi:NAD(P)-dependent dehydrogenase (short-subunit alcohol dehydrogenase family)